MQFDETVEWATGNVQRGQRRQSYDTRKGKQVASGKVRLNRGSAMTAKKSNIKVSPGAQLTHNDGVTVASFEVGTP